MSKVKMSTHSSEEASSSSCTSSSLSSDEEVDAKDLKPIKGYLSDTRELARQLFKSVKAGKIQMMLPQVLKKMDLGQLEEWCANELSGLSKRRIVYILNGQPMLESSDTTESDDSGPSLEIISDTEEWFTDEDICKKEEGTKMLKGKVKKDRIKQKGKPQLPKKNDNKLNQKKVLDNTYKNVQVKKEEDVDVNKEKEGDSLLDLLELEMRARAIRALIRKEEDVIPSTSKSTESNDASNENTTVKTEQDEQKEKESCRRQLERIISAQQNSTPEDEDVVLVVQPTPTIELLSSDSEGEPHSGVRVNKKLENERVIETKNNINHIEDKNLNNIDSVNSAENSRESKTAKNTPETHKEVDPTHKNEVSKRTYSNNVPHKDSQSKSSSKRRKTEKKSHAKEQSKNTHSEIDTSDLQSCNVNQTVKNIKNNECSLQSVKLNEEEHENSVKSKIARDNSSLNKQSSVEVSAVSDDYCDDMDDMVNNENDKSKNKQITEDKQSKSVGELNSSQKSNGTETWASRYYQTDDVQNVIKESKIQSEIRKRLRERQRLSKLSTSPNKNSPLPPPIVEATNNKVIEKNTMGSVDEYLALKHTASTSLSAVNSNNDSSTIKHNATDKLVENDQISAAYSKIQKVDKEANLSNNINVDNLNNTNNEKVAIAINVTNSG
ncbi:Caspase activity and apoptosis inhibitor 1 [Anthophora quadrimaculata]